jgi:hypothetical protein
MRVSAVGPRQLTATQSTSQTVPRSLRAASQRQALVLQVSRHLRDEPLEARARDRVGRSGPEPPEPRERPGTATTRSTRRWSRTSRAGRRRAYPADAPRRHLDPEDHGDPYPTGCERASGSRWPWHASTRYRRPSGARHDPRHTGGSGQWTGPTSPGGVTSRKQRPVTGENASSKYGAVIPTRVAGGSDTHRGSVITVRRKPDRQGTKA